MKLRQMLFAFLAAAALLALSDAQALAQAARTWVAGGGNDANVCSRDSPCKTFAGAYSRTSVGGEINCIDPGGYGSITITTALTIDCGGTFGAILNSGTNGINVTAGGINVLIRNLSINGNGTGTNGVRVIAGANVVLENVRIFGNAGAGVDIEPTSGTVKLLIKDSTIHNNAGGILLKPGASATVTAALTRVNVQQNNAYGLRADDRARATCFQCVADANTNNGFLAVAASAAAEINLVSSVAANNGNNGIATVGALAIIRLLNSASVDNTNGLSLPTGTIVGSQPDTSLVAGNTNDGAPNSEVNLK